MAEQLASRSPFSSPPSRFQFTLRSLLFFSLATALFFAGIFNNYNFVRYLTLLAIQAFLFYLSLAWAIYGRGYLRTFGIGASLSFAFPWLVTAIIWVLALFESLSPSSTSMNIVLWGTKTWEDGIEYYWPSSVALLLLVDAAFTGGSMVFARWLIDRTRRQAESPSNVGARPSICATTAEVPTVQEGNAQ
jgi:hypothetical protein